MDNFLGRVHLRGEGAPMHPEDFNSSSLTKEQFIKQALAYYAYWNMLDEFENYKKVIDAIFKEDS